MEKNHWAESALAFQSPGAPLELCPWCIARCPERVLQAMPVITLQARGSEPSGSPGSTAEGSERSFEEHKVGVVQINRPVGQAMRTLVCRNIAKEVSLDNPGGVT